MFYLHLRASIIYGLIGDYRFFYLIISLKYDTMLTETNSGGMSLNLPLQKYTLLRSRIE